jgi:hypothetical protein
MGVLWLRGTAGEKEGVRGNQGVSACTLKAEALPRLKLVGLGRVLLLLDV